MVEEAVCRACRIAVVGTVEAGLRQQSALFADVARKLDKEITLTPILVAGAFKALGAGDRQAHDELVAQAAEHVSDAELVVLAQASMAPIKEMLEHRGRMTVPVLASPQLMVERIRQMFSLP